MSEWACETCKETAGLPIGAECTECHEAVACSVCGRQSHFTIQGACGLCLEEILDWR